MRKLPGFISALILLGLTACAANQAQLDVNEQAAADLNAQLGIDYLREGRLRLAEAKLKKALEYRSRHPEATSAIAVLYAQLGDADKAERYYRRALSITDNEPSVRNNYGVFLCEQGRIDDAVNQFRDAVQNSRYRTPEQAYTNAGVCLIRYGRNERGEEYLRTALEVNPSYPDALYQMARLRYNQADYLAARGFIQRYADEAPHTPDSLTLAAQNELRLGNRDEARAYVTLLEQKYPQARAQIRQLRTLIR